MELSLTQRIEKVTNFDSQHSVLSQWEKGFLESVTSWAQRRGRLSEKQFRTFAKMEAKCNPEVIIEQDKWRSAYDDEKRAIVRTCAEYYKSTPYFSSIVNSVLTDPDFIPTEQQYRKMCENKYAQKIVAAMRAPALYSIGSTVVLRTPATRDWNRRQLKGVPCLVVEVLDTVVNAAKGAKRYNILPYGHPQVITVEERLIKAHKTPKKKTPKKAETSDEIAF